MNRKDIGLILAVVIVWGVNFTVIRLGLVGVPPMLLAVLRFVLTALPAVFFVRRPAVRARYWITYGLAVGVGQFGCLFYAMYIGMPAGLASVVMQSQAIFTLVFAAILLREPVSGSRVAGLGIAVLGLYLVGLGGEQATDSVVPPAALLLSLAGAASWGLSNIVVRKAAVAAAAGDKVIDMLGFVVWSSLVPPVPLLLISFILNTPETVISTIGTLNGLSIFSIIFLAFGATLFGFGTWSRVLSRYPTNQVAPLSLLVPVVGLLTAMLVFGERLSMLQWGGCFLIMGGLLVTTFGFPKFGTSQAGEGV